MTRLLLLLIMALVQAQPAVAALLCERHHGAMEVDCMGPTGNHEMPQSPAHHKAPMSDDCARTMACTAAAPVIVTTMSTVRFEFLVAEAGPHTTALSAATTLAAPPFHPPKA